MFSVSVTNCLFVFSQLDFKGGTFVLISQFLIIASYWRALLVFNLSSKNRPTSSVVLSCTDKKLLKSACISMWSSKFSRDLGNTFLASCNFVLPVSIFNYHIAYIDRPVHKEVKTMI